MTFVVWTIRLVVAHRADLRSRRGQTDLIWALLLVTTLTVLDLDGTRPGLGTIEPPAQVRGLPAGAPVRVKTPTFVSMSPPLPAVAATHTARFPDSVGSGRPEPQDSG